MWTRPARPSASTSPSTAKPAEILGGDKVEGIRMESYEGRKWPLGRDRRVLRHRLRPGDPGDRVSVSDPFPGVPFDADNGIVVHDGGRVGDNIYAVGWIKRGPTGVIGSNKPDGDIAATQIFEDVCGGCQSPVGTRSTPLLRERECARGQLIRTGKASMPQR